VISAIHLLQKTGSQQDSLSYFPGLSFPAIIFKAELQQSKKFLRLVKAEF